MHVKLSEIRRKYLSINQVPISQITCCVYVKDTRS